jgi:hypothetical protein
MFRRPQRALPGLDSSEQNRYNRSLWFSKSNEAVAANPYRTHTKHDHTHPPYAEAPCEYPEAR